MVMMSSVGVLNVYRWRVATQQNVKWKLSFNDYVYFDLNF